MVKQKKDSLVAPIRYRAMRLFMFRERKFFAILILFFLAAFAFAPVPQIAMWLGFCFAGYAAIANDSIQTIGTFLASNAKRPWWVLWLFITGIFVAVMTYSWVVYHGDVSFQRLATPEFAQAPQEFKFLQLAAPIVLLLLTRFRMPVSTTFLCLSAYSTQSSGIFGMLEKSANGYFIAFISAFLLWFFLSKSISKLTKGKAHPIWDVFQWIVSGILWAVWLMQDLANIAVTLPRSLGLFEFLAFIGYISIGMGILFYMRGDKIQEIITKKSETKDVRAATLIDLVYSAILILFLAISPIPMSTTWVFLGLLGGRELAIAFSRHYSVKKKTRQAVRLIVNDITNAFIGLVISILIAIIVNPEIQKEFRSFFNG
jgi:hypothetical protein